jgi:hypothetical protein
VADKTAQGQFADRLAQGNKAWKNAPVGGFKLCPIGHHIFVLEEAKIVESKKNQELFLAINYVIRVGEHKGEKCGEMFSLDNEERFGWLKARLQDLGYEVPDTKAEVEELAADMSREKPVVAADVSHFTSESTGKKYANMNNLVLLDEEDLAAELANEDDEEPEDEGGADEGGADEGGISVDDTVVFDDEDGDEIQGVVIKVKGDEATIKDEDGGKWNVDLDDLRLADEGGEDGGEDEPEAQEEGGEDEEDEQKTQLLTIADAHDVEVDEDDDVDDIIAAMKESTWKAAELADDEIAVLKEAGIKVVTKTAKKKAKKKAVKKKGKKKGKGRKR